MKSLKTYIIVLLLMIITISLLEAQPYEFKVLAANGKTALKKKSNKKWADLKSGTILYKDDQIKLEKGSYVGLVHSSGKTEEISKEGTYNIASLSKKVVEKKSNLTKRFTDYVVSEIGTADGITSRKDYREQMGTTGAVQRAVGGIDAEGTSSLTGGDKESASLIAEIANFVSYAGDNLVFARLPRDSYLIDPDVTFSWYAKKDADEYKVVITDRLNNTVFERKVRDTLLKLNLNTAKLSKETLYFWHVEGDDYRSPEYSFYWMDLEQSPNLKKEYDALLTEYNENPGPIANIAFASFFEENNFMNKAVESYENALKLAPEVVEFRKLFASYLYRIGLMSEAESLLGKKK